MHERAAHEIDRRHPVAEIVDDIRFAAIRRQCDPARKRAVRVRIPRIRRHWHRRQRLKRWRLLHQLSGGAELKEIDDVVSAARGDHERLPRMGRIFQRSNAEKKLCGGGRKIVADFHRCRVDDRERVAAVHRRVPARCPTFAFVVVGDDRRGRLPEGDGRAHRGGGAAITCWR